MEIRDASSSSTQHFLQPNPPPTPPCTKNLYSWETLLLANQCPPHPHHLHLRQSPPSPFLKKQFLHPK